MSPQKPATSIHDTLKIEAPDHLILECFGKEFNVLLGQECIVGRLCDDTQGPRPDVHLGQFGTVELGVSRCHIRISGADYSFYVTDLNSTNGTWLNGKRLSPSVAHLLNPGDELRLGKLKLTVKF
jgi:pSer/pThr/pTyr-binding forkhead associated (FHA) protein